ncbi:MAG: hypothetical protein Q8Q14_04475 [Gemmatimonadales bacterium]|nr:hypothetical protein [Gemmatimonadales bacterium]
MEVSHRNNGLTLPPVALVMLLALACSGRTPAAREGYVVTDDSVRLR